jgi:hypothetical protein
VRVRDHLVLSTAGAVLLYPVLGSATVVPWAASILIDADHYLWHCVAVRTLDPRAAVRFFNQAQPPQHQGTRLLHSPVTLALVLALSLVWHPAVLVLLGLAFHVALDVFHAARQVPARRAALGRDRATCVQCGARTSDVVAHLWRQPRFLPSYRSEHFASLCGACHERAHARKGWRPPIASERGAAMEVAKTPPQQQPEQIPA